MKKIPCLFFCTLFMCTFLSVQSQSNYRIVNTIPLPGDEKWDYLFSDDQAGRLYVSHGSMVQIIDEKKATVIGTITGINGAHGIAVAPSLNKGYITSGKDSSVIVFSTLTFKVISRITVTGKGPDGILYDPFSKMVLANNGKTNNISVINPATDKIEHTIQLPGKPEFSVSDGKGLVFVNLEDVSKMAMINTRNFTVEKIWPVSPGEEPSGLALDNDTHRLFSVCANKLMVIVDATSGKVIGTQPIGLKPDAAAFDPQLKRVYSSNGDGTLTIVQQNTDGTFKLLENFPTRSGCKTMTINKLTHHAYLSAADFDSPSNGEKPKVIPGTFVVLDIATNTK
jgi:DNA-binding beta-propeller fold protein YncE